MTLGSDSLTSANLRLMLESRDFDGLIRELARPEAASLNGTRDAYLGLAYFHKEDYPRAVRHLEAAAAEAPSEADLALLLRAARANLTAEIHVPVPEIAFFDRESLLAPPVVPPGALPAPGLKPRPRGFWATAATLLGTSVGEVATLLLGVTTRAWGRLAGYRDQVWTNWYRRPMLLGVLTLAYMRERLNRHNLKNTYPPGTLTGFVPENLPVPPNVTHFRTADGTWNNLRNPKEGAAGTRFTRNVTNEAIRRAAAMPLLDPNPRRISRVLLTREGPMKEVPFLNLLAATWIQFQNHDWVNHGEVLQADLFEIPLDEDDPARRRHHQTKLFVGRTQPDPTRMEGLDEPPLTFINEVTHWWDGSQIYGSDQKTVDRLRSRRDGKLRLDGDGRLPAGRNGIEETGFVRNWWIGLSMMHTLFAREHNAICDHLRVAYPTWDDDRLFNVARMINAAVMAKIHSVEWTPSILPNRGLSEGLHANWYGLLTNLLRAPEKRKTVADINVRNPELGGVVGNPIDKHGQPFGLTEEFVEVYRLHSLLPETLRLKRVE
ncbi:MAG TPA: peroxidase family protein, partial [Candidatus Eisenbacteria bacterium]|nr:peroxidase family protein [Candidatus Eisenbacteria bacterium]